MDEIVTVRRHGPVLVAHCQGPLDLASREDLRAGLPTPREFTAPGVDAVVVDLAGVDFLDCAALGVFTVLARGCATAGVRVLLAGARPIVRRLLTALEIDRLFVLAPDWQDAVTLAESWTDVGGRPAPYRPAAPLPRAGKSRRPQDGDPRAR